MNVNTVTNDSNNLIIAISGRIDSSCAGEFEQNLLTQIKQGADSAAVELDLAELTYVSSAGLRGLLKAQRMCNGSMVVKNVAEEVYEIFQMTGFTKILKIEGH